MHSTPSLNAPPHLSVLHPPLNTPPHLSVPHHISQCSNHLSTLHPISQCSIHLLVLHLSLSVQPHFSVLHQSLSAPSHLLVLHLSLSVQPHFSVLHSISPLFAQRCLWNSSNAGLTDDGPFSSLPEELSRTSSFYAALLQAINHVMVSGLCLQVVSQAAQHVRLSQAQAAGDGCSLHALSQCAMIV